MKSIGSEDEMIFFSRYFIKILFAQQCYPIAQPKTKNNDEFAKIRSFVEHKWKYYKTHSSNSLIACSLFYRILILRYFVVFHR